MAGEINLTVIGNLTSDPELRFTPAGAAVANFTVASTPRIMRNGEWTDGEPTFLRCNVWRNQAENIAEGLKRGDRVIVLGRLKQRSYETKEGEKRTVMELEVEEVGPSAKFKPVSVSRVERSQQQAPASQDPWGQAPPPYSGSGGGFSDEPPF
jgi:single-strand DNA-binding protein